MSNYPNRRDVFHAKLNKRDTPYVITDEIVTINDGVGESFFKHDNVRINSIEIWTETNKEGERITSFITETPSNMPWKTFLRVFANVSKVYVTYETTGDQVEADDVNELQSSISATQAELDRYKRDAPQGDMMQADYDTNYDGTVDRADVAGSAEHVAWQNIDGKPSEYHPTYHTHTEAEIAGLDKYTRSEVDGKLSDKADKTSLETHVNNADIHVTPADKARWDGKQNAIPYTPENIANKGQPGGYASLNTQGLIPSAQLPTNLKEIRVVETIADRNALTPFEGMRVHVIDASPDSTVEVGWAEYLWTGSVWTKTAEGESIDVVLDWDSVENKPTVFPPATHAHVEADITDLDKYSKGEVDTKLSGKSNVGHTHTESDITNLDKYTQAEVDSKLAGKADLSAHNAHVSNADIHVTSAKKNEWDSKAEGNHTHAELHTHANKPILDKITQSGSESSFDLSDMATKADLGEAGYGDMLKATYDTNNNGKVDVAETAESVEWTNVQSKPKIPTTASDVGAVDKSGDMVNGLLTVINPSSGNSADLVVGKKESSGYNGNLEIVGRDSAGFTINAYDWRKYHLKASFSGNFSLSQTGGSQPEGFNLLMQDGGMIFKYDPKKGKRVISFRPTDWSRDAIILQAANVAHPYSDFLISLLDNYGNLTYKNFVFTRTGRFGVNTTSPTATATIQSAINDTSNLQEWKDADGNVLAHINNDGKLFIGEAEVAPIDSKPVTWNDLRGGGG